MQMQYNLTTDSYREFINRVRNTTRDPNRYSHDRPVLPSPPANPRHAEYIDIGLQTSDHSMTARIRRYDLYLIGYKMENSQQWLEFSRADGVHLIPNSQYLGFGENYNDLGGLENLKEVGYRVLNNAIDTLATSTINDERKKNLLALAVMLCESVRFDKLSNIFADLMHKKKEDKFKPWMITLIHSWGDLSTRLLRADRHAINSFRLPNGPGGTQNALTREVGIASAEDAAKCLGILYGNYPTAPNNLFLSHFTISGAGARVASSIQGKGQPLVEIFSVCINNIDGEDPGDLYGVIGVTDGLGSFTIYNRGRGDSESIHPNDTASLTGPYRSISLCGVFIARVELRDKDRGPSPDDEVSKGSFSWDVYALSTYNYYDTRMSNMIKGKYGSATMYYSMFSDAVEAKVEVVLVDGDNEDPADVFGTIVGRYSNYDYSSDEQKKYYQTVLFNKAEHKYVEVSPGKAIPLSRSIVAVPTTSSLIIEANLWDYDSVSSNDEIANGTAPLSPKLYGKSTTDIKGKYGQVRVNVTWSQLSG